mmetsp:Transcript_5896/g.19861  ORF Transcript_5896/g.19861 Transcript_5896/m.19861 type:complete len:177 (-) Transcript_5896:154-684(-)
MKANIRYRDDSHTQAAPPPLTGDTHVFWWGVRPHCTQPDMEGGATPQATHARRGGLAKTNTRKPTPRRAAGMVSGVWGGEASQPDVHPMPLDPEPLDRQQQQRLGEGSRDRGGATPDGRLGRLAHRLRHTRGKRGGLLRCEALRAGLFGDETPSGTHCLPSASASAISIRFCTVSS